MPLSKAGLRVLNNLNFPNNTTQYISPELLREFNSEMITSLQLTQSMSEYAVINGVNNFIGNQNITGDLTVTGTLTVPVIHTIYETASVIYSSGSNQLGDELTDTQTLSGSVKVQGSLTINGIPVIAGQTTGSSLITASVLNNVITFTKGDLSQFNITVNTGSANYTDLTSLNAYTASNDVKWNTLGGLTGSYATTGSNTFVGNQIIDKTKALYTNALYWTSSEVGYNNLEIINQGGGNLDFASLNGGKMRVVNTPLILTGSALSSSNDISTSANIYGANLTASAIPAGTISSSAQITSLGFVSSSVTASSLITASFSGNTLTFTKGDTSTFGVVIPDVSGSTINTGSFATTGSNVFTGDQTLVDSAGNSVTLTDTSGSLILVAKSFTSASAHLTSSAANFVNLIFKNNSNIADTIISGSNNIFTNPQAQTAGYKRYIGGSNNLHLNNTSGIAVQITASAASVSGNRPAMNNNIFQGVGDFTINQAVNTGTHDYSQNFYNGGATTTINALAFTGSLNFNNNFNVNGSSTINAASASLAQIASGLSGSGTLSVQNNGNFGGTMTITSPRRLLTTNTQSSNNNVIAGGSITVTNISSSAAVNANSNYANGAMSYTNAGAAGLGLITSQGVMNFNYGALTIIASASALNINNNYSVGPITITNQAFSGSLGVGAFAVNRNIFNGQSMTLLITGSVDGPAGSTPGAYTDNAIIGKSNTIFSNQSGAGYHNSFISNVVGGENLIISASNSFTSTIGGGAYFGRYNANDGRRNKTGETVFLVGTGNSTARKTGLLIDSGSNMFVEGTLNVSGSTTMTGSLIISSSNATELFVIGNSEFSGTLSIQSGSSFFANGNKQFNVGAFQSNINQSGSANVSQSMNFEVTDISSGISIVSNSRITLANSGTYNIQFSAQLLADTGADDVYIWLKKNGTNVSASAGHVVLSNNEELIAAWNYVVDAVAGDYFELVWQNTNGDAILLAEPATGNIPSIPSIILTVTQAR